ncbi:hypothetical protein QJS10_CPB22g00298 [Acorus calamus]|uniref:Uncharacterized protein n=1 Tax=Acorus calamus TaxID=4465 RepID=A0AAV9BZK4_ACOCL|nr:hypothetical protein QJS10_CPB22g00298 [Acorus calamus]
MDGMTVRDCHKRLLKKTPFKILASIPKLQFQAELVDVIVNNYNLDGDYFEIDAHEATEGVSLVGRDGEFSGEVGEGEGPVMAVEDIGDAYLDGGFKGHGVESRGGVPRR